MSLRPKLYAILFGSLLLPSLSLLQADVPGVSLTYCDNSPSVDAPHLPRAFYMPALSARSTDAPCFSATQHTHAFADLAHAMQRKNWQKTGELVAKLVPHTISVHDLDKMAHKYHAKPVEHAVTFLKSVQRRHLRAKYSRGKLLQSAIFIESYIHEKHPDSSHYYSRNSHKLGYSVEVGQDKKCEFIHLNEYIGKGHQKQVYKSIYYDKNEPVAVARLVSAQDLSHEVKVLRACQTKTGVVEYFDYSLRKPGGKPYTTVFTKYYYPGALEGQVEKIEKLDDQINVAVDILTGLEYIHSQKITHRDLGARNYLIAFKGRGAERRMRVVISDFGRSLYLDEAAGRATMGAYRYRSPESIFSENMKGVDYFQADIYAVGCVLWRVIHHKYFPWSNPDLHDRESRKSAKQRFEEAKELLKRHTEGRREQLKGKKRLSRAEYLEYIILRMVHVDPSKRGTAAKLKAELCKLQK